MKEIKSIEQFESIVSENSVNCIIFTAPWCIDCHRMFAYMDETCEYYENKINFYKINRDNFEELFASFNIMGIPNLLFFKNNEYIAQMGNGRSIDQDDLEDALDDLLKQIGV